MSASSKCPHPEFDASIGVANLSDSNVKVVELKVRCKVCQEPMRFLGVQVGISLGRPTTSIDGLEIRLPTVPESEEPDKQSGLDCQVNPPSLVG